MSACKSDEVKDDSEYTPDEHLVGECAYRRGYFQGMFQAINALEKGASRESVENFLYERIGPWRNIQHDGQMVQPPVQKSNFRK